MIPTITKRWVFTAAQTNLALVDPGANGRITIVYGQATCSNSNTGDVSLDVGLAASTLPAIVNDSATGAAGVFMSHPGIAKGGGMVVSNGGEPVATGNMADKIIVTVSAAPGGSIRLVLTYQLDDLTPPA